ncbi:MAG TPA: hypothetical protein P5050_05965 [Bacteroidia bacterium]|nr:hypothetical protein [Sphingobacteriales bacterium]HPD65088.1 hypothetical protein [Bacteroidia bacterium]HRS58751.1 hypothetical protein [Bacteroidia bacterium]HRU67915.1 hypothetical protein [Bacteroidia bacterium]
MKRLLLAIILLNATAAFSQNDDEIKTLFGNELKFGGYGSFDMKFTSISNHASLLLGGKGGCILNHQLVLGGGGWGLSTPVRLVLSDGLGHDSTGRLNFGYGGVLFEYMLFPTKAINLSIPLLIGSGSAKLYYRDYNLFFDNALIESSTFFVLEPGIDIQLNLLSFMRFSLGASYRLISGTFLENLDDRDMSGLSINASFKFGYF